MMEERNSKKVLLSVLGVAILVVAVVGISFAALSYDKTGGTNTITTGTVTMSFAEATNGILLQNALPLQDSLGKELNGPNEYFDFVVTTNASAAVDVHYQISIRPETASEGKTLLDTNQVKLYLEKSTDGNAYVQDVAPTLISVLDTDDTPKIAGNIVVRDVTDTYDVANGGTTTTYYRLRMWVDSAVNMDDIKSTDEYRVYVDVYGYANPVSATNPTVTP